VRDAIRLSAPRTTARPNVRLQQQLAGDLRPVMGDANQLVQVVINLIGNAYDILIGAGDIEIATSASGPDIVLRIADSGAGIAREHLGSLFDPFFTTKEEGKGAGLGLAVSYAIVQEHGGRIAGKNRAGGGAEFVVMLPQAPAGPG
jgi:C4-dicarboxylate-specific signal transduction histidine kinase